MTDSDWLEIWYVALSAPLGVVVSSPEIAIAKAKLYKVRATAQDENLMKIQIRTSPTSPSTELWLINGKKS